MSMMAVCPKCGAQNSPMNATCDICQTALGAALVDDSKPPEGSWKFVWVSMVITAGIFLPCRFFHLGMMTLAALFYGPLIASYMARENQVWHAALGGVLAVLAIIVLELVVEWAETKALFGALVHSDSDSAMIALVLGIPILVLAILPLALTGASCGEHLCQWRRNRLGNISADAKL